MPPRPTLNNRTGGPNIFRLATTNRTGLMHPDQVTKLAGIDANLASPMPVTDWQLNELLDVVIALLEKVEYHLFLASDTELKDGDI